MTIRRLSAAIPALAVAGFLTASGFAQDPATPDNPFAGDPAATTEPAPATQDNPFGAEQSTPTTPAAPIEEPPDDPFGTAAAAGEGAAPAAAEPAANPFAATMPQKDFNPFANVAPVTEAEVATASTGITQLYEFRYQPSMMWDGRWVVVRTKFTLEEAAAFDQARIDYYAAEASAGTLPNYDAGSSDPTTWANWCYYWEQLELWSVYVDNVVLAGSSAEDSVPAAEMVSWPGTPAPSADELAEAAPQRTGAEAVVAANQGKSDFENFWGSSEGGQQGAQPTSFPWEMLAEQVVAAYNSKLDDLRNMEADQEEFLSKFEGRVQDRSNRRLAYRDWRNDQELLVQDYVNDWNRRYNGDVALIGGVRYELYKPGQVPQHVPRDANVVVTDYRLTPYDILDENGVLREAARN